MLGEMLLASNDRLGMFADVVDVGDRRVICKLGWVYPDFGAKSLGREQSSISKREAFVGVEGGQCASKARTCEAKTA